MARRARVGCAPSIHSQQIPTRAARRFAVARFGDEVVRSTWSRLGTTCEAEPGSSSSDWGREGHAPPVVSRQESVTLRTVQDIKRTRSLIQLCSARWVGGSRSEDTFCSQVGGVRSGIPRRTVVRRVLAELLIFPQTSFGYAPLVNTSAVRRLDGSRDSSSEEQMTCGLPPGDGRERVDSRRCRIVVWAYVVAAG